MKLPELLVPASSLEVLKVAVNFGADAVYIGGEAFGLRAKAKNFTKDEMAAAGCTFESEIPYIEFTIGEDGSVSWGNNFSTGFGYGGYSIYYANPDWYNGNTAAAADNAVVGENLIQICYTAMAVSGGSIAGSYGTGYAYISLPGGPNLADLL